MSSDKLVYSTGIGKLSSKPSSAVQRQPTDGIVRIKRETKGRKGKGVCTINGIDMDDAALKKLCTELKKACGTGGSVKHGIIEIQGDKREKIKDILENKGMTVKFAGG